MKLIKTKELIPFFAKKTDEKEWSSLSTINHHQTKKLLTEYFFKQETGWNNGPEKLARKYDYAVLLVIQDKLNAVITKLNSQHHRKSTRHGRRRNHKCLRRNLEGLMLLIHDSGYGRTKDGTPKTRY